MGDQDQDQDQDIVKDQNMSESWGPFGLSFLITQLSVSITHNSKMVGPIAKRLFGQTITLFP